MDDLGAVFVGGSEIVITDMRCTGTSMLVMVTNFLVGLLFMVITFVALNWSKFQNYLILTSLAKLYS